MARHNPSIFKFHMPPAYAELLLSWATHPDDKAVILGDLREEFSTLAVRSHTTAAVWYWRQTLMSLPFLVRKRINGNILKQVLLIMITTLVAIEVIQAWDALIVQGAAQYMLSETSAFHQFFRNALFGSIYMVGVALAGGLVAATAFNKTKSFRVNIVFCIGPVALSLLALLLASQWATITTAQVLFLFLRAGLAVPALIGGACIASRFSPKHQ